MSNSAEMARTAATLAGTVIRASTPAADGFRTKSGATDLVTDTDVAAGVAAVRALLDADARARIIVEEDEVYGICGITPGRLDDPEVWLVDPLDGTTSFVHGFPCYSVSVAHLRDGQPTAGAVYNVPADELVWGAAGQGAWSGGTRIAAASAARLEDALMVTGFPYDRGAPLDRQLAILARFLRSPVHGIRRDGSAAIDCCHVASGRADGFWEFGLKPWDTAAGVVILREAGAVATGVDGEPWTPASAGIIAANPTLHPLMLEVVAPHHPVA